MLDFWVWDSSLFVAVQMFNKRPQRHRAGYATLIHLKALESVGSKSHEHNTTNAA